jgi:CheY-like chemotaxis protein
LAYRVDGLGALADPTRRAIAERLARGERFDAILCDVMMPEMTGPELAKKVAAHRPNTRVLFMTGYTEHDAAEPAVLLHKPFSSSTLLGHVRRLLDGDRLKT